MGVFGIGIDIVEIARIEQSIATLGERFLNRVFTASEREYCDRQKRPHVNYAARFAVKEAVAKAFGTGIGKDLSLLDMTVIRSERGAPSVVFTGVGALFMEKHGITEVRVSLTHSESYAAANALALTGG